MIPQIIHYCWFGHMTDILVRKEMRLDNSQQEVKN